MAINPAIVPNAVNPYLDPSILPPSQQVTDIQGALNPMMTGAPGSSPLTAAAIEAWKLQTMPILQQQMQLQGLGRSPAMPQVLGNSLAAAMPQFINQDIQNRLRATELYNAFAGRTGQERFGAANVMQGEEGLTQNAAKLTADISGQEAQRQLQAFGLGGNLLLGLTDPLRSAAQLQQEQQKIGLQAFGAGGELQQSTAQNVADAAQMERLRQQGLAEQSSTGLFGGSILPPTLSTTSNTVTKQKESSSK